MVLCCLCPCLTWGATKWGSPDVLFFGDSGIDGWAAAIAGDGCTCGCPDPCVNALGNKAWKALVAGLRSRNLSVSHMGMNSAPATELCCCAPFMLLKNSPKRFIVTMMGANDLVWYPGMLCLPFVDYPMCSFDFFMSHVRRYGRKDLRVIYVPDQVGLRSAFDTKKGTGCLKCHKSLYDRVKDASGTVVTVGVQSTNLDDPQFTYTVVENNGAKHPNLVYIDAYDAYDQLIDTNGKAWLGKTEASQQVYAHHNKWVLHVIDIYCGRDSEAVQSMEMKR